MIAFTTKTFLHSHKLFLFIFLKPINFYQLYSFTSNTPTIKKPIVTIQLICTQKIYWLFFFVFFYKNILHGLANLFLIDYLHKKKNLHKIHITLPSLLTFTCSKSAMETTEKGVKYLKSWPLEHQNDVNYVALVFLLLTLNRFQHFFYF